MLFKSSILSIIAGFGLVVLSAVPVLAEKNLSHLEAFDSLNDFRGQFKKLKARNWVLVDFEAVNVPNKKQPFKLKFQYIGIWHPKKDHRQRFIAVRGFAQFAKQVRNLSTKQGLTLVDIESLRTLTPGGMLWAGVFRDFGDCNKFFCPRLTQMKVKNSQEFFDKFKSSMAAGYFSSDIDVNRMAVLNTYTYIAERYRDTGKGWDKQWLNQYLSWKDFKKKWKEHKGKNRKLVDISLANVGVTGKISYTGIWRKKVGGTGLYRAFSFKEIRDIKRKWNKKGHTMIDIDAVRNGDKMIYIGVWR